MCCVNAHFTSILEDIWCLCYLEDWIDCLLRTYATLLVSFLFRICEEVHRIGGHVLDKTILQQFALRLLEKVCSFAWYLTSFLYSSMCCSPAARLTGHWPAINSSFYFYYSFMYTYSCFYYFLSWSVSSYIATSGM